MTLGLGLLKKTFWFYHVALRAFGQTLKFSALCYKGLSNMINKH